MSEIFRQFMIQTPLWVWALLGFLIFRGVKARQPAQTSLAKLAIIPVIFIVWSIIDLTRLYALSLGPVALWMAGICIGALIGWRLISRLEIQADPASGTIHRAADKTLLPLLLLTFAVKYGFGATAAIAPDMLQQTGFRICDLLLSGTFTGIFIGKFARYLVLSRTPRTGSVT